MIEENQQLVKDALVEFQKQSVEVHQDCRKITHHFKGIYRIYPNLIKENRRMSTCNRMDLQKLGSQPVMPKNLPVHWLVKILVILNPTGWLHVDIFQFCFHLCEVYIFCFIL